MKFTLSWLKTHLDTTATLAELSERLTMIGIEVEDILDRGESLKPFVIAEVLEAVPHPNADKLRYCTVSDGTSTFKIVCGAPNARAGMKTVLAREGVVIPTSGMVIKKTKIRDVESSGMLCSERELGLGQDHNGIIDLPADAPVGGSYVEYAGLNDPVITVALTPNRGDLASVRGIARDLAASGMGKLKPFEIKETKGAFPSSISVNVQPDSGCSFFAGRYFKGVKNGTSPAWLKQRLKSIGLEPISALVDITNFITHDLGRPLHVFDADKLQGNITARAAKEGEKLLALNQKEYTLKAGMTVIADDRQAVGIGGIIGGVETGCQDSTVNVFLEIALFDSVKIRRTGRDLGIDSDARFRFERGVDPEFVLPGAHIATRMILDLCGGEVSEIVTSGTLPKQDRTIAFRPSEVTRLAGLDVPLETTRSILMSIGCNLREEKDKINLTAPSWRFDIHEEIDFVEEIVRLYGYDHLKPVWEATGYSTKNSLDSKQILLSNLRKLLVTRGLVEIFSWTMLSEKIAGMFNSAPIVLENPISPDMAAMRPSLLPGLLTASAQAQARGFSNACLAEIGEQFLPGPSQQLVLSGIRTGLAAVKTAHDKPRPADVFDAKADLFALLSAAGMNVERLPIESNAPEWYHPGKSGRIMLGKGKILGYFGELHPIFLKNMDHEGPVAAFELFFDAIPAQKSKSKGAIKLSPFQSVRRDFAFVVKHDTPAKDLIDAVRGADPQLIEEADIFDVYEGKGLEPGTKSLAISVTLRALDRTLSDEEITRAVQAIESKVREKTGATLRA